MYDYQSPIEIYTIAISKSLGEAIDDETVRQVKKELGIRIDEDELMKALSYDRDQYNKGHKDGVEAGRKMGMNEALDELIAYLESDRAGESYWKDLEGKFHSADIGYVLGFLKDLHKYCEQIGGFDAFVDQVRSAENDL